MKKLEKNNLSSLGKSEVSDSHCEDKSLGIMKRFRKDEYACEFSISLGLIKEVYENAIEYTGVAKGIRGVLMFVGLVGGAISIGIGVWFVLEFFQGRLTSFLEILSLFFAVCLAVAGCYLVLNSIRLELFRPFDEPIIFDRQHRKVYRIFRETFGGWRGLLKRWPLRFAEHDWDLIDAEHQVAVATNGATITRYHALMFLVRKSFDDSTLTASFLVGNSLQMGELTTPAVWEHIRRFMEEDGPHLPVGENLPKTDSPKTLLKCLAESGPYGRNFLVWWKEVDLLLVLILILFPIFFPILTCIGIFRWLSYRTSVSIQWPKHVLDAVRLAREG